MEALPNAVRQQRRQRLWLAAAAGHEPPLLTYRALQIIQDQVPALRVRQLISSFDAASPPELHRTGTYIGIDAQPAASDPPDTPWLPPELAPRLAATLTPLARLTPATQTGLINLGYAI